MRRLAGSDTGFLLIESPSQSSTCVDLVVLDPPVAGSAPLTPATLHDRLGSRLPLTPGLARRLRPVPLGLGHGAWVDDPGFALADHLHHVRLPAPGGEDELRQLVAETLPIHLDLRRPLWRLTLVDGLAGGGQALLFAFHHTLADGAGLLTTLARLVDDRLPEEVPPDVASESPAPDPGAARLLVTTLLVQLVAWLAAPALLVRTLRSLRAVGRRRADAEVPVPAAMAGAPHCVLNTSADSARDFARARLPLADVRRLRVAAGCSVSDAVLAVVAGGLRTHLEDLEELPDQPLVANVPVADDPPGAPPRTTGNVFANYLTFLPTDVADPRSRLDSVTASTAEARLRLELLGRGTFTAWLDRIPPALGRRLAARVAARQRAGEVAPDFNVLVSNLRVPQAPWVMDGRVVRDVVMTGPVADGAGLNVTVTGYDDHLTLALVVNPASVAEPVALAQRLEGALSELLAAYDASSDGTARGEVA